MKMLLVLRHGKSPHGGERDWERPLTHRARTEDIPAMVVFAQTHGAVPQWIISSDARRARDTAETFARGFTPVPEVILTRDLYLVGPEEILAETRSLPEAVGKVGWDAVPEAQKEGVSRPAAPSEEYLKDLRMVFDHHPAKQRGEAAFPYFVEAQTAWMLRSLLEE